MNEQTKEVLLLIEQGIKRKPFSSLAFTITFSLSLFIAFYIAINILDASSMFTVSFMGIYPVLVITVAIILANFLVFGVYALMDKEKSATISNFIITSRTLVNYSFIIPLIKFLITQMILLVGFMTLLVIFSTQTESGSSPEPVGESTQLLASVLFLTASVITSTAAFWVFVKSFSRGVGSYISDYHLFRIYKDKYSTTIVRFTLFNSLVLSTCFFISQIVIGHIILCILTLWQVMGIVRHSMGDKVEQKKKKEVQSSNLAFNF